MLSQVTYFHIIQQLILNLAHEMVSNTHFDSCLSLYLVWAGDVIVLAVLLHPGRLPNGPVGVLIHVAPNHSEQGNKVEHGENTHSDHELDQFGLVFFFQRDLHTHPVQSHNAH